MMAMDQPPPQEASQEPPTEEMGMGLMSRGA